MCEKLALFGGKPVRGKPFPSKRDIGFQELRELLDVIESGKLFRYAGNKVSEFERKFAKYFNVKYAVASTSGTAAIHIAVGAVNPNPGSEIITSPITDLGTIIPILAQNCIPVFADLDPETYTLDPESIEKNISNKTRIIIPVHLFGFPVDMDPIMEIAEKHDLIVIEDCAQAYLAEYKGRWVGTIGDIGSFSLQQSKHMTTGDGGITITNNDEFGEKLRLFMDKGWDRNAPVFYRAYRIFGFNYRMTELQGAVALAQLNKLETVVKKRRSIGERLTKEIEDVDGIIPPKSSRDRRHSFWLYPIRIDKNVLSISNIDFAKALRAEGIPASAGYIGKPLYMIEYLRNKNVYGNSKCPFNCPYYGKNIEYKEGLCPNAEKILSEIVTISINEFYSDKDIMDIVYGIKKVAKYFKQNK